MVLGVPIFSFILLCTIQTIIFFYKRKIQLRERNPFRTTEKIAENNILTVLSIHFTNIILFLINGWLIIRLNTLDAEDLNNYPFYLWAYAAHFGAPMLIGGASILLFVENIQLRQAIKEKIIQLLRKYS